MKLLLRGLALAAALWLAFVLWTSFEEERGWKEIEAPAAEPGAEIGDEPSEDPNGSRAAPTMPAGAERD